MSDIMWNICGHWCVDVAGVLYVVTSQGGLVSVRSNPSMRLTFWTLTCNASWSCVVLPYLIIMWILCMGSNQCIHLIMSWLCVRSFSPSSHHPIWCRGGRKHRRQCAAELPRVQGRQALEDHVEFPRGGLVFTHGHHNYKGWWQIQHPDHHICYGSPQWELHVHSPECGRNSQLYSHGPCKRYMPIFLHTANICI
jgi:hypothetical protein